MEEPTSKFDECWDKSTFLSIGLVLFGFAMTAWAYYAHFSPGKSIGALAAVAGIMSLRPKMKFLEKLAWIIVLVLLTVLEFRAIDKSDTENLNQRRELNTRLEDIKIDLENETRQLSVVSEGMAAMAQNSRPETATHPALPPQSSGKRFVSPEKLGLQLKGGESSSATVINDGTNEAGNFANQLVIGLRNGGWVAGGNNIKIGDPAFFPDSLTIEVSAHPESSKDHSIEEAKALVNALSKQGVKATLRFTEQAFPPNFMRIKVAGE